MGQRPGRLGRGLAAGRKLPQAKREPPRQAARSQEREFGGPHLAGAPFYGYDPVGNFAIHILVNNCVVILAGVVDNDGDKTIAGIKARGVKNVSQVNNELDIAPKS